MQTSHWATLVLLLGAGCAPLTFSNESSVDFQRYQSVRLELGGPDGSQRQHDYLEDQLRVHSGFRRVTRDPAEPVDTRLLVELSADSDHEAEDIIGDILFGTDEEEEDPPAYSAWVNYRLEAADGSLIDVGATSAEASDSFAAAESVLDLVVLHYLRPYRL
jgi:hypothetical protein